MKRIVGIFDHAGLSRRQDLLAPDDPRRVAGPYRVDLLMDLGYDLITVPPLRSATMRKVTDVVEHRTGKSVDLALRGALHAIRADAVFAMLESRAELPAWFKKHELLPYSRPRLGALSCWWADELRSGTATQRTKILTVIEGIDVLFVFSSNQIALFEDAGVPSGKVLAIPFGVDEDYFRPSNQATRFQVYSAGIDRGRDFASLFRAAQLLPDVAFDIFTHAGWRKYATPPNVTMHAPVSLETHRRNLASSEVVVVPTHDLAYPTGQSVYLEALSSARPTVITWTSAISEYAEDGVNCRTMPLHDPQGMAAVIAEVINDGQMRSRLGANARQSVLDRFTFRAMWAAVADALVGAP